METIDLDIAANLELGLAESVRYLRDVIGRWLDQPQRQSGRGNGHRRMSPVSHPPQP